ncbi:MAG: LysM peptidoglycan-binding domain-containing protein [Candidatus Marinimicrobia bacterium]|nr:LysM peptidoglycan-binding domain-containing protein [Candidatus Neomarinimicrobiota bacterium]
MEAEPVQKHPISEPLAANMENSSSTVEPSKPPATQPPNVEYVHVVKKGDTLWQISKLYLGNPLRYPELARLSRISDPDWIYPGDVVRIRKK